MKPNGPQHTTAYKIHNSTYYNCKLLVGKKHKLPDCNMFLMWQEDNSLTFQASLALYGCQSTHEELELQLSWTFNIVKLHQCVRVCIFSLIKTTSVECGKDFNGFKTLKEITTFHFTLTALSILDMGKEETGDK